MNKRAVIMAGGKGTRLRPYTVVLPKPLMPIGEYPILEVVIRQLVAHGFGHITIAVNHQAELIQAFFGDGSRWNVCIDYSLEDRPLGTIGPLRLIGNLPENFLVMNGDILTDLNYSEFYLEHATNKKLVTISSYRREHHIDYGVLKTNNNGGLKGFFEKPRESYEVSMGIYMFSRDILAFVPESVSYGFDNLMLDLLNAKKQISVKEFSGYWLDIGRPDDYLLAIEDFNRMKNRLIYD